MSTHIKFKSGDSVRCLGVFDKKIYIIDDIKDGLIKFKNYEQYGYYFDPKYCILVESTISKWKVESDGTEEGTKIYINGNEIEYNNFRLEKDYNKSPVLNITLQGE